MAQTKPTLAARRRTSVSPTFDVLEAVELWLREHRRTDQLRGIVGGRQLHLQRRSPDHPWAEVATYDSLADFAYAHHLIDRRPTQGAR